MNGLKPLKTKINVPVKRGDHVQIIRRNSNDPEIREMTDGKIGIVSFISDYFIYVAVDGQYNWILSIYYGPTSDQYVKL
jgi:hypothetical protein